MTYYSISSTRPALNLYRFTAYNTQAIYGWGDEDEADAYCDTLNRDRDINVYSWRLVTDPDEIHRPGRHSRRDEGR